MWAFDRSSVARLATTFTPVKVKRVFINNQRTVLVEHVSPDTLDVTEAMYTHAYAM